MAASLDETLDVRVATAERAVRVVVRGELDLSNALELRNAVMTAVDLAARSGRVLELDLADVSFCDSAGMRTLVEVHDAATAKQVGPRCVALHENVRYVAGILGLGALFDAPAS